MDIKKLCLSCYGAGERRVGEQQDGTPIMAPCTICSATGYITAFTINMSDLEDKVDDIKNKVDDIKEIVDEIKGILEA